MAALPLADGARLLGIHPKTLHHWLGEAHVPFIAHPTDARIKCVAEEHLELIAKLHHRPLQSPASPPPVASAVQTPHASGTESASTACSLPPPSLSEADLIQKLSCLETKVVTLQEQLAGLALALLQERERSVEQRISALETMTAQLMGRSALPPSLPDAQVTGAESERFERLPSSKPLNPAEQRARSRMPPLIEYSAQGTYVIVSAQEGELHLTPDSPEWFDWLATISSFRFVGKLGRFTAYRDTKHHSPTRSWRAYRYFHQHNYKCSLGVTNVLTLACLEQAAATLQASLPAL